MCRGRATPPSRLQNEYSSNSDPDLIINAVFVTRFLSQSDFRPRCLLSRVSGNRAGKIYRPILSFFHERDFGFGKKDKNRDEKYRKERLINARWREREKGKEKRGHRTLWTLTSFSARCIRAAKRYNHEDCSLCLFVRYQMSKQKWRKKKELIFFAKCAQKIFGAREMTEPFLSLSIFSLFTFSLF